MPRGSQSEPLDQVPETTSVDLAAAKTEADELTSRILELREQIPLMEEAPLWPA